MCIKQLIHLFFFSICCSWLLINARYWFCILVGSVICFVINTDIDKQRKRQNTIASTHVLTVWLHKIPGFLLGCFGYKPLQLAPSQNAGPGVLTIQQRGDNRSQQLQKCSFGLFNILIIETGNKHQYRNLWKSSRPYYCSEQTHCTVLFDSKLSFKLGWKTTSTSDLFCRVWKGKFSSP